MSMGRFSPTDSPKQVLLTPQKSFIGEFPTVWIHLSKTLFENRDNSVQKDQVQNKQNKNMQITSALPCLVISGGEQK
jgi:hypothetical protein